MTFHPKPNSTTVFYRKSQGVCVHLFLETIWRVFGLHNIKACAKAGPLVELADAHRPPGGQFSLRNGVLHSIYEQIWKTQQWPLEKVSFHPIPKKGNAKECSNYRTIVQPSHPLLFSSPPAFSLSLHQDLF